MEEVEFADPTMALRLAAWATMYEAVGEPFEISPPPEPVVQRYFARAGLAEFIGVKPLEGGADILLPVTRVHRSREVDRVGERLEEALGRLPARLAAGAPQLKRAFSELCDNACTHGESDHGMFLMLQRYGSRRVVLIVGDLGIGIPDHLGTNLPDLGQFDEGQRIARALRPGVSARNGESGDRGDGLARIVAAIRSSEFAGSELRIWSGTGRVRVRRPGRGTNDWLVGSHTRGTWAEFVLTSNG
jgi:hypothetical protein